MKTVFTNDMVPHVRAQREQESGRSNNIFFEGDTIYSYGHHFPMARWIDRGERTAVLFTTQSRSVTTSGHMSRTRSAIPRGVPVFNVQDPTKDDHKANLADYRKRILGAGRAVQKARANKEWKLRQMTSLVAEANRYAEFFGLKTRFAVPTEIDLAAEQEKANRQAQESKRRDEKRRAKLRAEAQDAIGRWKAGEQVSVPYIVEEIFLRVTEKEGERWLQTSKGAEVPLDHATRILARIRSGSPWQRNGEQIRVGLFQIDAIDEQGNVKAGCHLVKREEIERIALQLGL